MVIERSDHGRTNGAELATHRVTMRGFLALSVFAVGCASGTSTGGGPDGYASVRDRLADGPTSMSVASESSSGSLTARRRTGEGWVEGETAVSIQGGDVIAQVDGSGALAIDELTVVVAPIDIPDDVFKKPAQLVDVRFSLTSPAKADMQWTSDDDATATLTLALDFDWAIAVNGGKTPLGTQHLPPVMVDVALTGAGDHIDATLSLHADGELWNWADLLEVTKLDLALGAATTD